MDPYPITRVYTDSGHSIYLQWSVQDSTVIGTLDEPTFIQSVVDTMQAALPTANVRVERTDVVTTDITPPPA